MHPTEDEPKHELYLMCDDIQSTLGRLRERGVATSEVMDLGWGLLAHITLEGGETLGIYEPRHTSPLRGQANDSPSEVDN